MADGAFVFTKLIVGDLEKSAAFYKAVAGLTEVQRIDAVIGGRSITEIILAGNPPGPATLILFAYHDTPNPPAGDSILGFETRDIAAFVARVVAAGGSIVQDVVSLPEMALKYAFVKDNEGHLIEPLERG